MILRLSSLGVCGHCRYFNARYWLRWVRLDYLHKKGWEIKASKQWELSVWRGNVRLKKPDFLNFITQEVVANL